MARAAKKKKTPKAKKKPGINVAQLKEYIYKGSGKDKGVLELLKKLEKDGGSSLDSSGFGRRIKV